MAAARKGATRARVRLAKEHLRSEALLLKRTTYRDSDLIVTLFTERAGAVSAVARGARRSTKRFAGLDSMHLLRVSLELPPDRELGYLTEATLIRPRVTSTTSLAAVDAAGQGLRWTRRVAPPRTPEPQLWIEINALLDVLDSDAGANQAPELLAASGLRILVASGWGLELERCVRCGRACPPRARVRVDVEAGGVVCRDCGSRGTLLSAAQRRALLRALEGDADALEGDKNALEGAALAMVVIDLVEHTIAAHGRGVRG
jgi:DNA repair protein RecO (recombination protein O)